MKKTFHNEISHVLRKKAILSDYNENIITPDNTLHRRIITLEEWIKKILAAKEIDQPKAKKLLDAIKCFTTYQFTQEIRSCFPIHGFNPYIKLFLDNVRRSKVALGDEYLKLEQKDFGEMDEKQKAALANEAERMIDLFDPYKYQEIYNDNWSPHRDRMLLDLLENIRTDAASQKFKKEISNYERLLNQNYQSLVDYLDSLFAQHARLLVIRIDFGYSKKTRRATTEGEVLLEYSQAKADLEHLLNNRRSNSLFQHLLGYIWKLEYGLSKGFHFHTIFLFDGSKVQQDINIAQMVGEYWNTTVTQGRGVYFNCNAKKDEYSSLGIGMINYDDHELRKNLNKAAEYLVKSDYFVRIVSQGIGRTFGKGICKAKKNKQGRPRKEGRRHT